MNLTDQMMHLRKDLESLREKRFELIHNIKNDVNTLRTEVLNMRKDFQSHHKLTAQQCRASRQEFVSSLRGSVAKFRNELSLDLLGAHNAWFSSNGKKKRKQAKHHEEVHVKSHELEHAKSQEPVHVKSNELEHAKSQEPVHVKSSELEHAKSQEPVHVKSNDKDYDLNAKKDFKKFKSH